MEILTQCNTWLFGFSRPTTTNGISIESAIFLELMVEAVEVHPSIQLQCFHMSLPTELCLQNNISITSSDACIYRNIYLFTSAISTHTQLFYGSVDFVQDNLGEPVLEETFTDSHS